MSHESGGNGHAVNQNSGGSYDVGLWQINDYNWNACSGYVLNVLILQLCVTTLCLLLLLAARLLVTPGPTSTAVSLSSFF
jgi:hypothetical protein